MNASPVRRMMLDHDIMSPRRLASHAVYSHRQPGASSGHATTAPTHGPDRFRTNLSGHHPAYHSLRRLCSTYFSLRRRPRLATRPFDRNRSPGALGQPPRPSPPGTTCQQDPAGQFALLAGTSTPPGPRPDAAALPRSTLCPGQRTLPRPSQERHHALPRLRHRLPDPTRPACDAGSELRPPGRELGRRSATSASLGPSSGCSSQTAAVGPRFLQRRGHPLLASGPLPVFAAGAAEGSPGGSSQGSRRDAGVRLLAAWRFWLVSAASDGGPNGHGGHLRPLPQPGGSAWQERSAAAGVRLLGLASRSSAAGERSVSSAFWHRDELPADEPMPCADLYAASGGSLVLGGGVVVVAQRLGVAVLAGVVGQASWRAFAAFGGTDVESVAATVVAGGGRTPGLHCGNADGTPNSR